MKKKIDWLNHSLEFTVVLIGILIAFQLNKCANDSSKNELIDNHLVQIRIECANNKKKLNESIAQIRKQIETCDSLLVAIATKRAPLSIRNQATKLLDLRNVDIATNAYNVLVQSGDIRFLNDFNEKRSIIIMYERLDKIRQINQSNQNLYDTHYYPYLKANFDLVNWHQLSIDFAEEEEKLYYAKEFANIVSTYRFLLMAKSKIYLDQKEMISIYLNE